MRYTSKTTLLADIAKQRDSLAELIDSVPVGQRSVAGVWGDDWSIQDLVAHLAEWHRMFLRWYGEGAEGGDPDLPAPGYRWNQTPELNRAIWRKHKARTWDEVWREFDLSHSEVVRIAEACTEEELLEPGHFKWTKSNPLRTYLGANTASHYRFGIKVIKRWLRGRKPAQ